MTKIKPITLLVFSFFSTIVFANAVEQLPGSAFQLTLQTTARPEAIWALWEDVENWKQFDERLEYSHLIGSKKFKSDVKGVLKGKGAPKTRFILQAVRPQEYFEEKLFLPLGQTVLLTRQLKVNDDGLTEFTHQVYFKGGLKTLYYFFLAKPFRNDLIKVMHKMRDIAEAMEPIQ